MTFANLVSFSTSTSDTIAFSLKFYTFDYVPLLGALLSPIGGDLIDDSTLGAISNFITKPF
jgi:hypothetical protein